MSPALGVRSGRVGGGGQVPEQETAADQGESTADAKQNARVALVVFHVLVLVEPGELRIVPGDFGLGVASE
jgi:hypothetical protein